MSKPLVVLGVPSSAGAHHAGPDLAPDALRKAYFVERLLASGVSVVDAGDIDGEIFQLDTIASDARNLDSVLRVAQLVADAVEDQVRHGFLPIVIGGDCTVSLGVVAGIQRVYGDVGVAYIDGDADLSTPERSSSGILDATGSAHLLGVADTRLTSIGTHQPMLQAHQLVLLGYDPSDPDSFDAALVDSLPDLLHFTDADLRSDPNHCTTRSIAHLQQREAVLVHFDVDCIDSKDLPLANFPHYGTGMSFEVAMTVLGTMLTMPQLAAVCLTEVNPTHDPTGLMVERYVEGLTAAISASVARRS